jgi:ornithine lipid ester-linked acyl 2-hydroxylase
VGAVVTKTPCFGYNKAQESLAPEKISILISFGGQMTKPEFCKVLEDNWQTIRKEYETVKEELLPWYQDWLNPENKWFVYPIFSWPEGESYPQTEKVPFTAKLIKKHIPNHGAAGFSIMRSHAHIPPHEGLQANFLRCHLGLDVPEGDTGLKVGKTVHRWENGKSFVFDDRPTHEAWNKTEHDRIILLVDYVAD